MREGVAAAVGGWVGWAGGGREGEKEAGKARV